MALPPTLRRCSDPTVARSRRGSEPRACCPGAAADRPCDGRSFHDLSRCLVLEHERLQDTAARLRRENARLRSDLSTLSALLPDTPNRHRSLLGIGAPPPANLLFLAEEASAAAGDDRPVASPGPASARREGAKFEQFGSMSFDALGSRPSAWRRGSSSTAAPSEPPAAQGMVLSPVDSDDDVPVDNAMPTVLQEASTSASGGPSPARAGPDAGEVERGKTAAGATGSTTTADLRDAAMESPLSLARVSLFQRAIPRTASVTADDELSEAKRRAAALSASGRAGGELEALQDQQVFSVRRELVREGHLKVPGSGRPTLESSLTDSQIFESTDQPSTLERWQRLVERSIEAASLCFLSDDWKTDSKFSFLIDMVTNRASGPTASDIVAMLSERTMNLEGGEAPSRLAIHPYSRKRALWDLVGLVALAFDLFAMPLMAFDVGTGLPDGFLNFNDAFDRISGAYWTTDIVVSFFTGYASDQGRVEERLRKVAWHYFRTWFAFDFFLVMGDWVNLILGLSNSWTFLRVGKIFARFTRAVHLVRLVRVSARVSEVIERLTSEYLITFLGFLKLLAVVLMINHYTACGWYLMAHATSSEVTWVKESLEDDTMGYAYLTALHWSLTQFTPASMEVHPYNMLERAYNICVIVLALVVFSSFVTAITSAARYIHSLGRKKAEQEAMIRRYLCDNHISSELSGRVWHFVRTSKILEVKRVRLTEVPCWKTLPQHIRADIRLELFAPLLRGHPIFALSGSMEPMLVSKICREVIVEQPMMMGEDVFKADALVDSMFFVADGRIRYHEPSEEPRLLEYWQASRAEHFVEAGEWACEIALWARRVENIGKFRAWINSEIVKLEASKFRQIMKGRSEVRSMMMKYAAFFVARFNEVEGDLDANENLLFNRTALISDLLAQAKTRLPSEIVRT